MTEGVIGLALLCMLLTMAAVMAHMYINRISCIEAARHAAWICGNGAKSELGKNKDEFYRKFFYQPDLAKWKHKNQRKEKETIAAPSTSGGSDDLLKIPKSWAKGKLYEDQVTYGVSPIIAEHAPNKLLPYPLMFLNAEFPIIDQARKEQKEDKSLTKTLSQVEGDACWPDIKDSKADMALFHLNILKTYFPLVEDAWKTAL